MSFWLLLQIPFALALEADYSFFPHRHYFDECRPDPAL